MIASRIPDDLAPGEDPLPLARRYDRVLLATQSVAVGETRVPPESVLWRRPDRTTAERVLLFPRRALAVSLAGEEPVALHPGQVVVPWTHVPFHPPHAPRRRDLGRGLGLAPAHSSSSARGEIRNRAKKTSHSPPPYSS